MEVKSASYSTQSQRAGPVLTIDAVYMATVGVGVGVKSNSFQFIS